MTPKEKAEFLYSEFVLHSKYWNCYDDAPLEENHAFKSTLICINEILAEVKLGGDKEQIDYWKKVKKELKKEVSIES